jgi:hypothetical protein
MSLGVAEKKKKSTGAILKRKEKKLLVAALAESYIYSETLQDPFSGFSRV